MLESWRVTIKVGVGGQRERVLSADFDKAEARGGADVDTLQKRDRGSATTA